jgi:oligopeptide transport system permease protein
MNTSTNEIPQVPAELFAPAPPRPSLDMAAAPGLPFWRALAQRLLRDARATVSLLVIAVLLLAALAGEWLWPIDPAQQILGSAAQGPMRAQQALVVDAALDTPLIEPLITPLLPAAELGAVQQLGALEANTENIKLRWQPLAGAYRYRVYRNTHAPRSRADLGLPLGATASSGQISFSDGLLLRQREYFYSVVASDGAAEANAFATIAVMPKPAISLLEAQLQGLLAVDRPLLAGTSVQLPAHPLGTDHLGRDLLARLLQGARVSLFVATSAALLYVAFGLIYGAIAGFAGGALDHWLMRIADFVIALPFLLFMILLRIAFGIAPGESGVLPLVIALVLLSWPATARLVRGQVLQLREEPYVAAARLAGAGNLYIIVRHLLPNMLGVILVTLTFAIPNAIFTEAFLSFIGMGVTPPATSWGAMSSDGVQNLFVHPAELIWPAACISITVLAFNLLGDALRDALDMKVQR